MNCRFCGNEVDSVFLDLIACPPSNSFVTEEYLNNCEIYYPLKVYVCEHCFLVQIDKYKESNEIFSSDYVYFSSMSKTWLKHSQEYVEEIIPRLNLTPTSRVAEIASNDGYLLQYFKRQSIPCFGIEPASSTAQAAKQKGIEVVGDFFGVRLAKQIVKKRGELDLILGNNVLAHVPDLNDFVEGMKIALKQSGTITMEFPHLMKLIDNNQFDTIYHEHFSYFSFLTVSEVFKEHGLDIYDVKEISTHGGSLRIYVKHSDNNSIEVQNNVLALSQKEKDVGMGSLDYYMSFKSQVLKLKNDFIEFLVNTKMGKLKIAAYGAAAKGNTLLNYCGIKNDYIDFVVDAAPSKQGKFLPGSHIPVVAESMLKIEKPDFVIIFPWNIKDEIMEQIKYIKDWGGKFVIPVPQLEII